MTTKLTISVPDQVADEARRAVREGRAASVSGWFHTAAEHFRRAGTLDDWLAEADDAAGAPPSAALLAEVDTALASPSA
ncbi:MAG: hypothetical protein L0H64_02810 [Pseudonocardia sp.]|nr:hypothetical protein [Pseudonocardia sp.]